MTSPASSTGTGSTVLDDLAGVIGEEAALALAAEFMGERVYIPKDPEVEPRIAGAIGAELALKMCDVFWRTYIPFPSKVVIERQVMRLCDEGVTKREIARRLKIREARVFAILARHRSARVESDQMKLF